MPTYYGSDDPETIAGSVGSDTIYGFDGADTLYGGGSGDYIEDLSDGNVIYGDLYADAPADRADGGDDTILGGIGNQIYAGIGNDYITALGSSTLDGGAGNDTLIGNDWRTGAGGINLVIGGFGADLIRATGTIWTDDNDTGTALEGGDRVIISYRDRVASGLYTIQDFKTGSGGDVLALSELFNDITPNGFDGLNPLIDQVQYLATGARVVLTTGDTLGGNSWMRFRQVGADVLLEVDATGAGNGSDYLTVVVLKNTTLASLASSNFDPPFSLDGSLVNANITGTAGGDLIYSLDGADTIAGGAGDDTILGTYGNDSIDGGAGADEIHGGQGNDTLVGNGGPADNSLDQIWGDDGNDVIRAGSSVLYAQGGAGADSMTGGLGDDTLYGDGERDTLQGGAGDDYLFGGSDWDTLDGGTGRDYLSGDAGDDRLFAGVTNVAFGAARQDVSYTVIATDTAGDYLDGGADSDTLIGGAGADTLVGGTGQLTAFGNGGNDTVVAEGTGHWVDAGTGDDNVDIGGSSTVFGGEGADFIAIRLQGNVVDTGTGSDTVYLRYGADWGSNNVLSGFTSGAGGDKLDLTDLLGYLATTAGYDYSNPFTTGWLRLVASGANTQLQIDLTGSTNGAQWLTVLTINNTAPAAITSANFIYNIAPTGDTLARTVNGGGATDLIEGWDGADSISGNGGDDRLDGGFGGADTLSGGDGNDSLFGFSGVDSLLGGGANDFAFGGSGNDSISGGDGDDNAQGGWYKGIFYGSGLFGGTGNDTIDGGIGDDQLSGDEGNDSLIGGIGNDGLSGGDGNDTLRGGDGNDYLDGGSGRDSLYGEAGNDSLNLGSTLAGRADGGAGSDSLSANGAAHTLIGGTGDDSLYGSSANGLSLQGGVGNDTLWLGSASGALLDGGDGNDTISAIYADGNTVAAGAGNDLLQLGGGGHTVDLGSGNDTLDFENANYYYGSGTVTTGTGLDVIELSLRGLEAGLTPVVVTDFTTGVGGDKLDLSSVLGRLAELGYDYSNPLANGWLRFIQSGADTLLQVDLNGTVGGGNWSTLTTLKGVTVASFDLSANLIPPLGSGGVMIVGSANDDVISDTAGPGPLRAGLGNDTLIGLGGNDLLDGASGGADSLDGGDGDDRLFGFDDSDRLDGGGGADFIFGGSGNDSILGGDGDDIGDGGLYKGTQYGAGLFGGTGNDTIDGGSGDDYLSGDDGDDVLLGGLGTDQLSGGAGNDSMLGGDGDDYLYAGEGNDTLWGGSGNDYLDGATGLDTAYGEGGNDQINLGGDQAGRAEGGEGDDSLYGASGAHTLLGGVGDDTLWLGSTAANASLDGGEGKDTLTSLYSDRIRLDAGAGDDLVVVGGAGHQIDLGAGNDTLDLESSYYWLGSGTVTTGAGADLVEVSLRGLESGLAALVITDFSTGTGGDRLDLTNVLGRLAEGGYDYSNPFTNGWLRLTQSGANTLLQVDTDGRAGGTGWVTLTVLQNTTATSYTSANFVDDISPTGFGLGVEKTGTEAADSVIGSDGSDTLGGLGGNDLIDGGFGGNDQADGGEGDDRIYGFSGNDTIDAGLGDDFVFGGSGNDVISGGAGNDQGSSGLYKGTDFGYGLVGGTGNDTVDGGDGDDALSGDDGDDSLLGGTGNDYLSGGAGNDTLRGGDGADSLRDGSGRNELRGDAGNDQLDISGADASLADGGSDNDTLSGSGAAHTLVGGNGDDSLWLGYTAAGASLDGGEGNDLISTIYSDGIRIDAGAGDDTVQLGGGGHTVNLGAGNDTLDMEESYYWYGAGSTVTTGTGSDRIELSLRGFEAGFGALVVTDFVTGVAGDVLDLTSVLGRLAELGYDYANPFTSGWLRLAQTGADSELQVDLNGSAGGTNWTTLSVLKNTSAASFTTDNFAPGHLSVSGYAVPQLLDGGLAPDTLTGWDGNDVITGNGSDDLLDGGFGGADQLSGDEGNDRLYGFSGNDTLSGGLGDDFVFGGSGDDSISGGAGDDQASSGSYKGTDFGYGLVGGSGDDTLDGGDGDDALSGDSGDDSLVGGTGNDWLYGGEGNDTLRGGDGADSLSDASGQNLLQGDAGNDQLSLSGAIGGVADGGGDDDSLTGVSGAHTLIGGTGNDSMWLGSGAPGASLSGGDGNDLITTYWSDGVRIDAGAGNDILQLSGSGSIVDLGAGDDRLDLADTHYAFGSGSITTGSGVDTVEPSLLGRMNGMAVTVITDFSAGAGGDLIDLADVIHTLEELGMPSGADPFSTGYLRLTGSGTATTLEYDSDAGANGLNFRSLLQFQNVANPASITAANFVQAVNPAFGGNPQAPLAQSKTVTLAEDSGAVALAIATPSDPDGGAVKVTVDGLPEGGTVTLANGIAVTTGQALTNAQLTGLRFTPYPDFTGDAGSFSYAVRDNEGSIVVGEIHLQVTDTNDPPVVTDGGESYLDSGSAPFTFDLDAYAQDGDGDPLTITVTAAGGAALPSWMSFDAQTHVLSGTAPRNGGPELTLTVTATDPSGASDTGLFTLYPSDLVRTGTLAGETLEGYSGNDYLDALGGNDSLYGNAGSDQLLGGEGNDLLDGGASADEMSGGKGNDRYIVDDVSDVVVELAGGGTDTVESAVSHVLGEAMEKLVLTGSALNGTGNNLANTLTGNASANLLNGGSGADTMAGGAGNDSYVVDNVGDVVTETSTLGSEIDSVSSSVNWTLGANLEKLTLTGSAALSGTGNGLANLITGNAAANLLDGGAGADTLVGGTGDDSYLVDSAGDLLTEKANAGTDTVQSSVSWTLATNFENLTLTGSGAINGSGTAQSNVLLGNGAANVLTGGAKADTLTGGAGADTFNFDSLVGSDLITDFASGTDKLGFSQAGLKVGDGDALVEGALSIAVPGGFAASAELVIATANISGGITAAKAAAAIGSATSAYSLGQSALFAVDNGVDSAIYYFKSADTNGTVSAAELTLLGSLAGAASTGTADFMFGP